MKKKLLGAIFAAVFVLGACGGGDKAVDEGTPDTGNETVAVDAEKIVSAKCISCHGGNLEGASGPKLSDVGGHLSEAEIHDVIINGQGGMPGGIIEGDEADAVAKWLAEKK